MPRSENIVLIAHHGRLIGFLVILQGSGRGLLGLGIFPLSGAQRGLHRLLPGAGLGSGLGGFVSGGFTGRVLGSGLLRLGGTGLALGPGSVALGAAVGILPLHRLAQLLLILAAAGLVGALLPGRTGGLFRRALLGRFLGRGGGFGSFRRFLRPVGGFLRRCLGLSGRAAQALRRMCLSPSAPLFLK